MVPLPGLWGPWLGWLPLDPPVIALCFCVRLESGEYSLFTGLHSDFGDIFLRRCFPIWPKLHQISFKSLQNNFYQHFTRSIILTE